MIKPGLYKHRNGNLYQVMGVARHSESLEELVVYQALYGSYGIWVRPIKMFTELIEVEGKKQPRFEFLGAGGAFEFAQLR